MKVSLIFETTKFDTVSVTSEGTADANDSESTRLGKSSSNNSSGVIFDHLHLLDDDFRYSPDFVRIQIGI